MSLFSSDKPSSETGHINVIAEVKARPGYEAELRQMLEALVAPSREEDGCKGYHLLEDAKQPGSLYTYEEWTGEDKLQAHLQGEGVKAALAKVQPMLDGEMKLTVLKHLV